jgi:hypothetical protein
MPRVYPARRHKFDPDKYSDVLGYFEADIAYTSSGGTVTWANQAASGSAYDLTQSIGSAQPTLVTNALNGHSAIRFNGSSQYLIGGSGYLSATSAIAGLTIIAVMKCTDADATQYAVHLSTGNSTSNQRAAILKSASNVYQSAMRCLDGDTTAFPTQSGGSGFTSPAIFSATFDYATPLGTFYRDGISRGTASAGLTAGTTSATNALIMTVGCRGSIASFMNGDIYALAIIKNSLTGNNLSTQRAFVANWRGQFLV